jgi:CDP-diacylglycerol---glycerol-3-phosphate 3-phosphatidyltransferase
MPNLITVATWVTLSRLLAVPIILAVLTWEDTVTTRQVAIVTFLLAALTDWLDGYLARRLDQVSELGKFLDPLVDKLLVISALLMLVQLGQIPAWAVFLVVCRELIITGWRGAPDQDQSKTAIAGANIWGKAKTVSQIVAIAFLMLQLPFALLLFWLSVALTLISGAIYLLPKVDSVA